MNRKVIKGKVRAKEIQKVKKVCAVGAGTMGAGTAVEFAKAGWDVSFYVRDKAKHEKAMQDVATTLKDLVTHGLIAPLEVEKILRKIKITDNKAEAAAGVDLVMESVKEDVGVKQETFRDFDGLCPAHAIFATNTSSLNPTEIASVLSERRQKQFVVMHGFNPPHLMPLVEVVPGEKTSEETMTTAIEILKGIDKKPVRLNKATPGFVVNYMQVAILWAALDLHLSKNIPAEEIDKAVRIIAGARFEQAGPLELGFDKLKELTPDVAKTLLSFKMKPVAVNTLEGIANHLQAVAFRSALELVAKGTASAEVVDRAFVDSLGRRLIETGPLESADLGGLDIFQAIFNTVGYLKTKTRISRYLERKVKADELGTKSKSQKGIYTWTAERSGEVKKRRIDRLVWHLLNDARLKKAELMGALAAFIRPPRDIRKQGWRVAKPQVA